ncbi:dihydrolipoamide acetyltransferase family protein [Microbulbifer celer]|uniref:Dihydrolipoamide acetyltransferase component of pyruvate dehydrogenase complex n=1 Tax=Microbulbifer celer TaxID=435905 RepID=A0ABW3U927_9GAMM|nr:dihydrolipoamide acetyltransferase family protein [Microbulbifer celer]UFN57026.1 2-oxo acid dehydrogenase subunit E2 [Microbulbifer celer]
MKIFKLPDLGEGLPDAVIREWHIEEGESIAADASLVTVETAKALVEVPAPWSGVVEKRFGEAGDTLQTGEPLVGFAESAVADDTQATPGEEQTRDSGTVVGQIEQGTDTLLAEARPLNHRPRTATPAVRALARRLGVELDDLHPAGARFSEAEVLRAAARAQHPAAASTSAQPQSSSKAAEPKGDPARRAMGLAMSRSRDQVCPMTLCDEADISDWRKSDSATLKLLRAIAAAAAESPNLNAHFTSDQLQTQSPVNIGLAVDSPKGLFVPVLKDVEVQSDDELLAAIERFKQQAAEGAIPQDDLQGATIHLSNFGSLGGRFATPVVVPPLVCIVGVGRRYKAVLPHKGKARVRRLLPLSITADHRAVTGGELARFLVALKTHLTES